MKRLLCTLVCIVLILAMFPAFAQAETLSEADRQALETLLIDSMDTNTPVDLSQFRITIAELEEVYKFLLNSGRFSWNADTNFEYVVDQTGYIAMFRPQPLEYTNFDERVYEEALAELIAETFMDGMEPWQQLLNIHEYIITHCTYDSTTSNNSYSALVDGKTACYGYSRLFLEIMERIGIPCKIVIAEDAGNGLGHAWNVVQLDGEWYHIDLTWDDPTGCPRYGFGKHDHFLKSDADFLTETNGHNFSWNVDVTCGSRKYSAAPVWETTESPIVFLNKETMLLRRNTAETLCIYAVDCQTMDETLLYEESIPISSLSTGAFLCGSFGLSLYEGRIYFTNSKEVLSILPDGTDRQVVFVLDASADSYIISCDVQEGTLLYTLADATGNYTDHDVPLSIPPSHVHSYDAQTFAPTCTEDGYTLRVCDCGIQYETDHISACHILSEEIINREGVDFLRTSCQNCNYLTEEEYIPVPSESTEETTPASDIEANLTAITEKLSSLKWIFIGIGSAILAAVIILIIGTKAKRR